jgi:uncharacterized protein (TIGR02271 family)
MTERDTVVGVFADRTAAQQAINELKRIGFTDDHIGIMARDSWRGDADATDDSDSYAAEGGAAGLATGAGVGALWGLGIVAGVLPAIGPAIAGGTLAAILTSAAAGAAAAGLAGTLIGLGIPKNEAEYYQSEVEAGRIVVTVRTGGRYQEALAVMRRFGGYDMSTREAADREFDADEVEDEFDTGYAAERSTTATGERTIQAREEELRVRKQPVQTGEAVVSKEVHTEHKSLEVPVEREELVIERHAPTGNRTSSDPIREGEKIRVPLTEEQVHVEKQPVVTEEVTVGKRRVQDTQRVGATVRKEEIKVDKSGGSSVREEHGERF